MEVAGWLEGGRMEVAGWLEGGGSGGSARCLLGWWEVTSGSCACVKVSSVRVHRKVKGQRT